MGYVFFVCRFRFTVIFACCETGASQGLAPRFWALQKPQISKYVSGVRANALTPLSLHVIFSANLRLVPFSALKSKSKTLLHLYSWFSVHEIIPELKDFISTTDKLIWNQNNFMPIDQAYSNISHIN